MKNTMISITQIHNAAGHARVPTVELSTHAEESTYMIARYLMQAVDSILTFFGQHGNSSLFTWVYALLVFAIALSIGWVLKVIVVFLSRRIGKHLNSDIYFFLLKKKFFTKMSRIVPAIVFLILIEFTLTYKVNLATWLTRLTWIYIILEVARSLTIFATAMWEHIDSRENKRRLPLKGIVQLIKGIVWGLAVIVIMAMLLDKSPGKLLAGLGAFAAVLMLIFKDSILGLVAGVQLSENDSLHVGDWVKVDGTDANGTVTEVTLTSVKIMNFDKTIVTVPPYQLVSGSFTNYRNMQLSHTRRICRSLLIDADSVMPATDELIDRLKGIALLKPWIEGKLKQKAEGKRFDTNNPDGLVDGTIETNLGIYRAYARLYLDSHPRVMHEGSDNTCFVSTLPQTPTGIPFQVYCFTDTSAWLDYESIQDGIFEHLCAALHLFSLCIYEESSGRDTVMEGYVSSAHGIETAFGLPYPFLKDTPSTGSSVKDNSEVK